MNYNHLFLIVKAMVHFFTRYQGNSFPHRGMPFQAMSAPRSKRLAPSYTTRETARANRGDGARETRQEGWRALGEALFLVYMQENQ